MRVLVCTPPMSGHVIPMLPLARALTAAGHSVLMATAADGHRLVVEGGLSAVPAGLSAREAAAETVSLPEVSEPRADLPFGLRMFAEVMAPAKLPVLDGLIADWGPQLVVHSWPDLAAPLAAASARVPTLVQGLGLVPPTEWVDRCATLMRPLWRGRGLPAPDGLSVFGDGPYLDPVPPSLQPNLAERVPLRRPMRLPTPGTEQPLPDSVSALDPPLIYVSLGTMPAFNQPERFAPILEGLATLDTEVVVTVGHGHDPAAVRAFGRTSVLPWLPLAPLLSRCDLVVCHGGSGTTLAACAAGVPLVLLPQGADQFLNAAACSRFGAGRALAPDAVTADSVAAAARDVRTRPEYRTAAGQLRKELDGMPAPDDLVAELGRLAHLPATH